MAHLVRVVKQSRWFDQDALDHGVPSEESLRDLHSSNGSLSVFKTDNDTETERIAVGFAASRNKLEQLDYFVFDDEGLASIGIELVKEEGTTIDVEVNRMHYNLEGVSDGNRRDLAAMIADGTFSNMMPQILKTKIERAVAAGFFDKDDIKPKLRKKLCLSTDSWKE